MAGMYIELQTTDPFSPVLAVRLELPCVIGRGRDADLRLNDRYTADAHCELFEKDGRVYVRNLRSKHVTLLNGRAIRTKPVTEQDELVVGIRTLRIVQLEDELETAPLDALDVAAVGAEHQPA